MLQRSVWSQGKGCGEMTKEQVSTCCPEASVRVSFALILTKSHRSWFPSFCHNDRHSFPDQRIITTFHNMLPLSSKVICTEVLDIKKKKNPLGNQNLILNILQPLSRHCLCTLLVSIKTPTTCLLLIMTAIYFCWNWKPSGPFEKPKCISHGLQTCFKAFFSFIAFFLCVFWNRLNLQSLWLPSGAWRQRSEHTQLHTRVSEFTWIPVCICCGQIVLPSRTTCYCSCKCDLTDFFPSIFPWHFKSQWNYGKKKKEKKKKPFNEET